jgi:D-alanine transfer protein
LLLRTLRELGARPLLLSMPLNGSYFDQYGVTRPYRDVFYNKIRALAEKYGAPLIDFKSHDYDEAFSFGHHDHLSLKGWLYFDRALDDFFHGRPVSDAERQAIVTPVFRRR